MRSLQPLVSDISTNPWDFYKICRRDSPIMWSDEIQMFCVYNHELVKTILKDNDNFTVEYPFRISKQILGETLLDIDGYHHRQQRKITSGVFNTENIEKVASMVFTEQIQRLIAELHGKTEIDFVSDFAQKLPARVICQFLTIDSGSEDYVHERILYLTSHLDGSSGDFDKVSVIRKELEELLLATFQKASHRDSCPRYNDLESINGKLSPEQKLRLGLLLLAAGTETSICSLSNMMWCLVKNDEWLIEVKNNPAMIPLVVQEILRWEPPQHDTVRFAKKDVYLNEVKIPEGAPIKVIIASANRDENVYKDAECFRPLRQEKMVLSFGFSSHSCLGKTFATTQLEMSLKAFLKAFPKLSVFDPDKIPPIEGFSFRRPQKLLLKLT